jgi:hypothetical protein
MSDVDYKKFKRGEEGPIKGSKIIEIISRTHDYIIYIDENNNLLWSANDSINIFDGFGYIRNEVSSLELVVNRLFKGKEAFEFKVILGSVLNRIVCGHKKEEVEKALISVKELITKQGCEILKQSYIYSDVASTVIVMLSIVYTILQKEFLVSILGNTNYEIILVSLFGGIGSFIFTNLRLSKYKADINLNKNTHILDGCLRIFFGVISGIFVVLGIKGNLIFSLIEKNNVRYFSEAFICIVAGASDVLIPNLIRQVENNNTNNQ